MVPDEYGGEPVTNNKPLLSYARSCGKAMSIGTILLIILIIAEPSLRLRVMPEDWRWKEGEHYRWREPGRGHGYWRGGTWIEIK